MTDNIEKLETLLLDWELGELDDENREELREILRSDTSARQHFVNWQTVSAAMSFDGDNQMTDFSIDSSVAKSNSNNLNSTADPESSKNWIHWFAAIAAALALVLGGRLIYVERFSSGSAIAKSISGATSTTTENEPTSSGVAMLTRAVDVVWADEQSQKIVGDALNPGRFAIESGFAQIEFFCGATVVIEGPAELELTSPMLARVHHGKLRAQVPPAARGFTLDVEDMQVVDLGTEFGLNVGDSGAEVQVFDGEVELARPVQKKTTLTAGQSILRDTSGNFETSQITPDAFLDIKSLEARASGQNHERFEQWKSWSETARKDSRLIAYYGFDAEGSWTRRLECSSMAKNGSRNSELDGAIVGAQRSPGRWQQKGALEFKRPGDRVRVQIPGEYSSVTFACWTKIDSLDRKFNSLFLTDGYDSGEPHWQILESGQIYFSLRPVNRGEPGPKDFKVLSPQFWDHSLSGKWIHLAVTCDLASGVTKHFLNGKLLSQHVIPESQRPSNIRFGVSSIGNWDSPTQADATFAIRNLNGSIDELMIYHEAIDEETIAEIYSRGKP